MAWDDTPYWMTKDADTQESPKSPHDKKMYPSARVVLARSERCKRAEKPSPLLEEYMRSHGLEVK